MWLFRGWIAIGLMVLAVPVFAQTAPKPVAGSSSGGADEIGSPAHPATEEQIREYLALVGAFKTGNTLMSQTVSELRASSAPYFPQSFWDDMSAEFHKVDLIGVYVKVFPRFLSQKDMANVIAFYRSASGKKLLEAQPLVIADARELFREEGRKIGKAVYERHKAEIETAKKKYESGLAAPATK